MTQEKSKIIASYLSEIVEFKSESAKSHRFSIFVNDILGVEPDFLKNYISGIESYIKDEALCLRGSTDNLFGNIILEFKKIIPINFSPIEQQLIKYVAILWSNENLNERKPYICIATDGIRFLVFTPVLINPNLKLVDIDNIRLDLIEDSNWKEYSNVYQIYYWLDKYLVRQEIIVPTSEAIVADFGAKSHALKTISNKLLTVWNNVKAKNDFAVIKENWEKYLRIVYGDQIADDELLINHTFLATLAKLISWKRIAKSKTLQSDIIILEILEGKFFKAHGIENFIEEDFFSWIARGEVKKIGIDIVRWLFSLLNNYNLELLSEDVLKSLYQELIDPESRHYLGEFYTPDWLAHKIVLEFIQDNPEGSFLDPSCGSGTFLYFIILEKIKIFGLSNESLNKILDTVCGADIHPLAVIIAKTNYILALGDLLSKRESTITIPVYLADTIKLPTMWADDHTEYEIKVNEIDAYLPVQFTKDYKFGDWGIELAKEYALQNKGLEIFFEQFRRYLIAQNYPIDDDDKVIAYPLYTIAEAFKISIDNNRDTIWAYILKNMYKPLFFQDKFDFIVGNPPWVVLRTLDPDYQKFVKNHIKKNYRLLRGKGHLITHMELATLFFARTADLYLKPHGKIGFVLPRSVFTADQHDEFRKMDFVQYEKNIFRIYLEELWDCEHVVPLFKVPTCVVFGKKVKLSEFVDLCKSITGYKGKLIEGKLNSKNASYEEAVNRLMIQDVVFNLNTQGSRTYWSSDYHISKSFNSYYKAKFSQGSTIVPRNFWFVKIKDEALGFDSNNPILETDKIACRNAKPPYNKISFSGNIESKFLFATLLSSELTPFNYNTINMIILPILITNSKISLIDSIKAKEKGYYNLAKWLENAENSWKKIRGKKTEKMDIYQRLNHYQGLVTQNPNSKYKVFYNTSGTYLTSSFIDTTKIQLNKNIQINNFISDCKTYYYDTNDKNESRYLSAILNSPYINELIKPMQSRGLWGARDIHKKVLELPIPKFDNKNQIHIDLATLANECSDKVQQWKSSEQAIETNNIGRLRGIIRKYLSEELKQIDVLVKKIIS